MTGKKRFRDETDLKRCIGDFIIWYQFDRLFRDVLDRDLRFNNLRKATEFKRIQDVALREQQNLEKLAEKGSEITGLATGFTEFDKLTSGLQPNAFIIIAARPAMGKTAFALNIATSAAKATKKNPKMTNTYHFFRIFIINSLKLIFFSFILQSFIAFLAPSTAALAFIRSKMVSISNTSTPPRINPRACSR